MPEIFNSGVKMPKGTAALEKIHTIRDLKGEVYKILRKGITSGTLEPGTRLKENDLAEELAVSRTPIREALNQLSREDLVEIIPRKGAFVKRWTHQEALEVLFLRLTLEGLAGRLATPKMSDAYIDALERVMTDYQNGAFAYVEADQRFHAGIVNACGMQRLKHLIRNLHDSLQMQKILALSFKSKKRIRESMAEHRRIVSSLRARDENAVEEAIKSHFKKTRDMVEHMQPE